jgi:CO/xanthine dehydrogenase FAD-binding subunit
VKAAPFDYARAENLAQALDFLARFGGEAKLIAGGMSLVPMMAMRLARPAWLVDIDRLEGLKSVAVERGVVRMGAGVRQKTVEHSAQLQAALPLVGKALHWVGHQQTRNRGTVGGSLAYADPSAELPLCCAVLGAVLQLESQADGARNVQGAEFFLGPMSTAIGEDECLTDIEWPVWQGARIGAAFEETAIRHGDFAMASAACQLQLDGQGAVGALAMGLGGVDGTPLAFPELAAQLVGQRITPSVAKEMAQAAAARCDPGSDMHAQAPYRRHLAAALLERVLLQAAAEAAAEPHH